MKRAGRIITGIVFAAALGIAWLVLASSKSAAEKQLLLLTQAEALMDGGIYVRAVPLLEEAAGYKAELTEAAETELKRAYLALIETKGYQRKYTKLLENLMGRDGAGFEVFAEAAGYYIEARRVPEALDILKRGIEKTGDERLASMYEEHRYGFNISSTAYDYVSAIYGAAVQVRAGGKWGLAASDGVLLIPCEYDKISTFSSGKAVVRRGGEVFTVNIDNNRLALLGDPADDFGNLAHDRIALSRGGKWELSTGEFRALHMQHQNIGMFSEGYAAAMSGNKWGVISVKNEWLLPPEYDGVIRDELGRCYAQGAVFVRINGSVHLFSGGQWVNNTFDDARPFSAEGYAAVKKNGKWGFIDTSGNMVIRCKFDDALSFGQHAAAVRSGELWGYVNLSGQIVIEPAFKTAKSFSNGSAPVLTERGWQFITLLEYKDRGAGL